MSKLVFIGLAAAALGIGGLSLPSSEKSGETSSQTVSVDFATPAQAAQPVAQLVSAVVGPFERSAQLCADKQRYQCVALARAGTVQELIPRSASWEEIRAINGWNNGEVSPDTVVPALTWIAFSVKRT